MIFGVYIKLTFLSISFGMVYIPIFECISSSCNASLIRPRLLVLVVSDFVVSDELCLDLNHGHLSMHGHDQLVEGQVVVTNFGVEPTVPYFTIIFGGDGSVKNKPCCCGLGLYVIK